MMLIKKSITNFQTKLKYHFDGLVQERHNSSALAMELCLSCTNPPICQIDTKIQQFEIIVSVLELFLKDIQFCVHSYIDDWWPWVIMLWGIVFWFRPL